VTGSGFRIASANHNNATNGPPASYPSVYLGCHYDNCTRGSNLPMRVSDIASVTSSIKLEYESGSFNAAYDIWLDPAPRTTGQNGTEVMIWLNRQGAIQPIGSRVGTTQIGGRTWEVWSGNIGWNVVSYVAPSAISSAELNVLDFIEDVLARGAITDSWYLTSIQAGFEPWIGGAGLSVTDFSARVEGRGTTPPPPTTAPPTTVPPTTTPPPTTPPPTTMPPPPGGGTGSCQVSYTSQTWDSGLVAYVKITNTGSTVMDGWDLRFGLPAGQSIEYAWNADVSTSGSTVTARNIFDWNRRIDPGSSVEFGFQAIHDGNDSSPTTFRLGGTTCRS
jgi:hypothetical protein